jgi:hypothetical protein
MPLALFDGLIEFLTALGIEHRIGFVVFFLGSAVAVRYHDHPAVRRGWSVAFVLMLFVPLVVGSNWPFVAWVLYGDVAPTETTHYRAYLVESDGDHVRYDARALDVVTSTVMRGYSERLATDSDDPATGRAGEFFVRRANDHRRRVTGRYAVGLDYWLPHGPRFPRHQLDHRWSPAVTDQYERFVALRVYRVDARIARDGSAIERVDCTPVRTVPAESVSTATVPPAPERAPPEVCRG